MPSSGLLRKMHRKRQTKHENSTQSLLKEFGLSCPIPIDYVDIGEQGHHEIFRVESYLRIFSLHDKMGLLLGHTKNLSVVKEFWHRHRQVYPNDPVFSCHAGREEFVIPCFLHADEGRTLKKSSILVCNLQPVLGGNPDPHYDPDELHTNMKFSSWATRLLMFVMLKKVYHKDSGPIDKVWASLSEELLHLFEHGVELILGSQKVTIYIAVLALKGDWPMLAKMGKLVRFFGRRTRKKDAHGEGICHLCLGGCESYPYHDCSSNAAWRATYLGYDPFGDESSFACLPHHGPLLYRFDVFHCCHKGIMAELAGSALVGPRSVQHLTFNNCHIVLVIVFCLRKYYLTS